MTSEEFRALRRQLGLHQTELAAKLGMTQPMVSRVERGALSPATIAARCGWVVVVGAIASGIGNPLVDGRSMPARPMNTDPDLGWEGPIRDLAIDGRAGQAGAIEDGLEAEDFV